jgi:hypothetical protein
MVDTTAEASLAEGTAIQAVVAVPVIFDSAQNLLIV